MHPYNIKLFYHAIIGFSMLKSYLDDEMNVLTLCFPEFIGTDCPEQGMRRIASEGVSVEGKGRAERKPGGHFRKMTE